MGKSYSTLSYTHNIYAFKLLKRVQLSKKKSFGDVLIGNSLNPNCFVYCLEMNSLNLSNSSFLKVCTTRKLRPFSLCSLQKIQVLKLQNQKYQKGSRNGCSVDMAICCDVIVNLSVTSFEFTLLGLGHTLSHSFWFGTNDYDWFY